MIQQQRISSGSPWEPIIGYSRMVEVKGLIEPEMPIEIEAVALLPTAEQSERS